MNRITEWENGLDYGMGLRIEIMDRDNVSRYRFDIMDRDNVSRYRFDIMYRECIEIMDRDNELGF